MPESKEGLTFSQFINAPQEHVCYAFTTAQGWRDWCCDSARFEARPGGSYQLAWNRGWYAAGTVRELIRPVKVALTWFGMGDPGPTDLAISLKPHNGGTMVELRHTGFSEDPEWEPTRIEVRKGWERGLENLASIFDTGEDLRITRRPMLGITISDFDKNVAKQLGVPVTEGIRIERPLEGMGAERAGVQPDDVIVGMAGKGIHGFADLTSALDGVYAGDTVEVVLYRGPEKVSLEMELSGRPVVDVPLDAERLAKHLRSTDEAIMREYRALFNGVSEGEAEYTPSPDDWSAKEVLAHLILGEWGLQFRISELICDAEREFSPELRNVREQLQAMLTVTPTIPELLDRMETSKQMTAALLAGAKALNARKGVLWRLGQGLLQLPGQHERSHIGQIKANLEAARTT